MSDRSKNLNIHYQIIVQSERVQNGRSVCAVEQVPAISNLGIRVRREE